MNIAFWDNQLNERGTTVALYDYAYYNQTIFTNKSFIFYNNNNENISEIVNKFKKEFTVYGVNNFNDVDKILVNLNISHIYIIKHGVKDNIVSSVAKNLIHCVFTCNEPHGDIYASISPQVEGNDGKYPVVPHMINLPSHNKNMREKLNIPESATVFGGYGGKHCFNIIDAINAIHNIANNNQSIYFLFANFINYKNINLPNVIYLDKITDLHEKVSFINTIDAMISAKHQGETFGIAIGEFSVKNKPIICCKRGYDAHKYILGNNALWYTNENDLIKILINFNNNKEYYINKDWNCYKEYSPEKVMKIFNDVFLL